MRTFYFILLIISISVLTNYSQINSNRNGDDNRLNHNGRDKAGEPKTDPRNPTPQETRPKRDYTPVRAVTPERPYMPLRPTGGGGDVVVIDPPVFIEQPVITPGYDRVITPTVYSTPITSSGNYIDYKSLGKSQFNAENYYDAVESFQLALATDTSDYSLYYQLGIAQIAIERYVDAIQNLSRFINSVTYNGMGYYQRGLAKFYLGIKDKALDDFLIADQLKVEDVKLILKRFYDYY
jgi:tetratricopeptide (TPR) repeat protein